MFWTPYPTPLPSFGDPLTPPASEPDAGDLITARFGAEWLPFVEGALQQLELQSTWKGTDDEIYVAQRRAAYLKELIATGGLDVIDPPFWDAPDGGDSETDATADTQVWYGLWNSGAGFVDSLAGFVFTGFVAVNFGVEAAITFATTLTRFRLAFRTRNTGAILRVLLDDDTFALVDTFSASPGVKTVDIVSPGTTLIIQNTGTANADAADVGGLYSMEIIRKRLWEGEVSPDDLRYDPTSDSFQRTPDGGVTWVDSPGDDPRHSDAFRKPPLSGTGHECDAAARIVAQWKETVDGFVTAIDQYAFATNFIALVVEFLPGAGTLIDLALIFFNILAAIGVSAIEGAFTDAEWHTIQCIINCHIAGDGSLSASQMDAVFAEIDATQPDVVKGTLHAIRGLYGEVLTSNASVERTETGDCSDCDCGWCQTFDFTVDDGGFTPSVISGLDFAVYVAGVGWTPRIQSDGCDNHAYTYLLRDLPVTADNITFVEMDTTFQVPFTIMYFDQFLGGAFQQRTGFGNPADGVYTLNPTTTVSCDSIGVPCNACDTPGGYTITRITLKGRGTNPFTDSNCAP